LNIQVPSDPYVPASRSTSVRCYLHIFDLMFYSSFATIMVSVTSVLLPLFPVGLASCQEVDNVEQGFFAKWALHDVVGDAIAEGSLALAIFGLVTVLLKVRRNSKVYQSPKATPKAKSSVPDSSEKLVATPPWRTTASKADRQRLAKNDDLQQEVDAIEDAVKRGRAGELPGVLDAALARVLTSSNFDSRAVSEEEVAFKLLHSAVRACAATRCFSQAVALYTHMAVKIGEGSAGFWSVLLYCSVEAGNFHRGSKAFENLCRQGTVSSHDFHNMVRCCVCLQDVAGLQEKLTAICSRKQHVDTLALNRALAACSGAECALELAEVLAAASVCSEGLDTVGYNTLMKYNARMGRLSRCLEIRSQMLNIGLEASEVTFGILLEACVSTGDIDNARNVFKDLFASGLCVNVVHCTTFIKALIGANKLDEAAGVIQDMANSSVVKPDLITYSTLVKAYAENGNVTSAVKMLQHMLDHGLRPDEIIFNAVLTTCSTFPLKAASVMQTFEKLNSLGMRPTTSTLSILVKALALSQSWTIALRVVNTAHEKFGLVPEMRLYAQLAQACVKARDFKVALEVFDDMTKESQRRSLPVDAAIVGRFIQSCLSSGAPDTAAEIREAAKRAGISLNRRDEQWLNSSLAKRARS